LLAVGPTIRTRWTHLTWDDTTVWLQYMFSIFYNVPGLKGCSASLHSWLGFWPWTLYLSPASDWKGCKVMGQNSQNPITHCVWKNPTLKGLRVLGGPVPNTKAVHSHPGNIQEAQEMVETKHGDSCDRFPLPGESVVFSLPSLFSVSCYGYQIPDTMSRE